jgi:PhnB protein
MSVQLNPYLSFKDNAREAMEFYKTVFGGTLEMTTFEKGGSPFEPGQEDKIMHADLRGDNGITFFASDAPVQGEFKSGTITMPLEKAPWGDQFGMLNDKFGVAWMVNIAAQQN